MKTFIRACEVWLPSADRTRLEFAGGAWGSGDRYGSGAGALAEFGRLSASLSFGWDEGLPGKAWRAGHPLVLKEFTHSYFRRTEAAHAAGLDCGIAVPVFAGDFLTGVVVLFCGSDADTVGAIELWHHDPAQSYDMALQDGVFGAAEAFEWSARHTRFRRGFGLPGLAWEAGKPVVMDDLTNPKRFLRAGEAAQVGISLGLAIPCPSSDAQTWIMTFLSARSTPIAPRFEIWLAHEGALVFGGGHCVQHGDLAGELGGQRIERSSNGLGRVLLTGTPFLDTEAATSGDAGLGSRLVLPLIDGGRLSAVVAFYFRDAAD